MMEASDYLEDDGLDEGLFHFDNEQDEAAAMDHLNDMEPKTPPYGLAGPSAAAHTGAASGRLHLSSAQVWQSPEQSSPPALSYSPSPGTTSAFQYRHQASSQRPESVRHERKPCSPPPPTARHSHQLPGEGSGGQGAGREANHLPKRISDLDLRYQYEDSQRDEERVHRPSRRHKKDVRQAASDDNQYLEDPQHFHAGSRSDHRGPKLASPHALDQVEDRRNHRPPSYDTCLQPAPVAPEQDLEGPRLVAPPEEKEYVVIPEEEVLQMEFNGDEESRITAEKLRAQVVQAAIHNGKVVLMVTKATGQWWTSPEMRQRRRTAARMVYNAAGQVLSGAGHVLMTSTPLGGFYNSVSTNVTRFRADPLSYTMTGLGFGRSDDAPQQPDPKSQPVVADEHTLIDEFEDGEGFVDMFYEE